MGFIHKEANDRDGYLNIEFIQPSLSNIFLAQLSGLLTGLAWHTYTIQPFTA